MTLCGIDWYNDPVSLNSWKAILESKIDREKGSSDEVDERRRRVTLDGATNHVIQWVIGGATYHIA